MDTDKSEDFFRIAVGLLVEDRFFIPRYMFSQDEGRTPKEAYDYYCAENPWMRNKINRYRVRNIITLKKGFLRTNDLVYYADGELENPNGGIRKVSRWFPAKRLFDFEDFVLFGYNAMMNNDIGKSIKVIFNASGGTNHLGPYHRVKLLMDIGSQTDSYIVMKNLDVYGSLIRTPELIKNLKLFKQEGLVDVDFSNQGLSNKHTLYFYRVNPDSEPDGLTDKQRCIYYAIRSLSEQESRYFSSTEVQQVIKDMDDKPDNINTTLYTLVKKGHILVIDGNSRTRLSITQKGRDAAIIFSELYNSIRVGSHHIDRVKTDASMFRKNMQINLENVLY